MSIRMVRADMLKTLTGAELDALITGLKARPRIGPEDTERLNQLISTLILVVIPEEYNSTRPLAMKPYFITTMIAAAYWLGRDHTDTTQQTGDMLLRQALDEMT